jgi:hypothetical protein
LRTLVIEHPVRIFEAEHLMVLNEIDAVGLQTTQRLVELPRGLGL